jgi:hypothetical protein
VVSTGRLCCRSHTSRTARPRTCKASIEDTFVFTLKRIDWNGASWDLETLTVDHVFDFVGSETSGRRFGPL